MRFTFSRPCFCVVVLATALIASPCSAATWSGAGNDNLWTTPANWGGAAPAARDSLSFAGSTRLGPNNDFTAGTVFDGLAFNAGAGAFNVGGVGIVLDGNLTNDSSNAQTIALPIIFAGLNATETHGTTAIAANSAGLTLSGPLTRTSGSAARFVATGGPVNTTLVNNAGGILGAWATIGTDWASAAPGGNVVPYAAYTNFAAAAFPGGVSSTSNLRWSGGATLTLPNNTELNTFMYTETLATARRVNITGTLRFANGGGIFRTSTNIDADSALEFSGGAVTAGAPNTPAEFVVRTNAADESHNLTVNFFTSLNDNGPRGPVTVIKTGPGALRFNNPNNYSGGTYLHQGTVRAQANIATAWGTGPVYVADGAQLYINAAGTAPNDVFLTGVGIVEELYTGGAFRIASTGGAITGTITLTGDALLGSRGAQTTTGTGARFIGRITGNHALSLNVRTGQGSATTLNMPTMTLESPLNDWSGGTIIGRGRVRIGGAGEVLPHGAGKGDIHILGEADVPGGVSSAPSVLNLNALTETVNGLWSDGTASRAIVESTTGTGRGTLLVGAGDASAAFGGILRDGSGGGGINLVKTGAGVQTLSGASTYTGTTMVEGGTLLVNGTHTGAGQYTVQSGASLGGTGSITTAAGVNVLGALSPGASIGQLTVTGNVTFGAASTLKIEINGSQADKLAITGNLTVTPGAALELQINGNPSLNGFVFATYTGTRTGDFSSVLLPPGYRLSSAGNQLVLETVPEPTTLAPLVGAWPILISLARSRRRTN